MILCPETLPEGQVLENTNTTIPNIRDIGRVGTTLALSIEDIGRVGTLCHNLHIGFIAIVSWAQVSIENTTDDAFIAEEDQAIAGPVIGVDMGSLKEK
jgi:hypothetical protein